MPTPQHFDAVIAGAGIIGLSLALELHQRGLRVAVLERARAMQGASWAAGGMLAALDPENPPALRPLSLASIALYPEYLDRVQQLSGLAIPLRTRRTLQQAHTPGDLPQGTPATLRAMQQLIPGIQSTHQPFFFLEEDSLDPRDLCRALPAAARALDIPLLEETSVLTVQPSGNSLTILTTGDPVHASHFINCAGAWSAAIPVEPVPVVPAHVVPAPVVPALVIPAKGQAVALALPADRLRCVLRMPGIYLIPRGDGRVVLGATIEQAGFDPTLHPASIQRLVDSAATLLPEIRHARQIESWVGFRPSTPDGLPLLGPVVSGPVIAGSAATPHCWLATGHFRNGILLAPITARLLAQAILGEPTSLPLDIFSAARFAVAAAL